MTKRPFRKNTTGRIQHFRDLLESVRRWNAQNDNRCRAGDLMWLVVAIGEYRAEHPEHFQATAGLLFEIEEDLRELVGP
jgi:hypothetical protein